MAALLLNCHREPGVTRHARPGVAISTYEVGMESFCNVHEVLAAFVPFFIVHDSQVKRFDNPFAGDT